jgi:hypothetical protein
MRFQPTGPPRQITVGADVTVDALWSLEVRGSEDHWPVLNSVNNSLFVSDGRGTGPRARFRRLDLETGTDLASVHTGSGVRCLVARRDTDRLLAATGRRLLELDVESLEKTTRWERLMPRYVQTMAAHGSHAVLANWLQPNVSIVALEDGRVHRRHVGAQLTVLSWRSGIVAVGKGSGGTFSVDPSKLTVGRVADTPPCHDAALSVDGRFIWLTVGVQAVIAKTDDHAAVRVGPATRLLEQHELTGPGRASAFELPVAVRTVTGGEAELWCTTGALRREPGCLVMISLPVGQAPARVWRAPHGHGIAAVDVDARLVLTVHDRDRNARSAQLTLFRLGAVGPQ